MATGPRVDPPDTAKELFINNRQTINKHNPRFHGDNPINNNDGSYSGGQFLPDVGAVAAFVRRLMLEGVFRSEVRSLAGGWLEDDGGSTADWKTCNMSEEHQEKEDIKVPVCVCV